MSDAAEPDLSGTWTPGGWTRNIEELIACVALLAVVLATFWGVFTRYVSAQPSTWAPEIAAAGFCWAIFIGSAAVFKRGAHVSIDLGVAALPVLPRRAVAFAIDVLVLGFLGWVSWLAIEFTIDSWDTPMPSLRWPYSWHYAGAALGFAAMTLRQVQAMTRRLRPEA